jgi:hypothetical protein
MHCERPDTTAGRAGPPLHCSEAASANEKRTNSRTSSHKRHPIANIDLTAAYKYEERHAPFPCHIKLIALYLEIFKSNTTKIMARTVAVAMCVALVVVLAAAGAVALPADTKCGLEMPSVCNEAIDKGTTPPSSCCSVLQTRSPLAPKFLPPVASPFLRACSGSRQLPASGRSSSE